MCFFLRHIFFSSLNPSFSFFTPSEKTQNSLTTTRQNLDVFFMLIFISIVIYTSIFTPSFLYLFTLILMLSLYYCFQVPLYNYKGKLQPVIVNKMLIEIGFKEVWVFERFLQSISFGFSFTIIRKKYDFSWWRKCSFKLHYII